MAAIKSYTALVVRGIPMRRHFGPLSSTIPRDTNRFLSRSDNFVR